MLVLTKTTTMMMLVHTVDIVRIYRGHPTTAFHMVMNHQFLTYGFIIIQNWMALEGGFPLPRDPVGNGVSGRCKWPEMNGFP